MTSKKIELIGIAAVSVALAGLPRAAVGQPTGEAPPSPETSAPSPDTTPPSPASPSTTGDSAAMDSADNPLAESPEALPTLTLHLVTTRNTYSTDAFDIFDVGTHLVAASGKGADEGAGEKAATFDLKPGLYKIVRRGEPFHSREDFATVQVTESVDYVIVVDPTTGAYRGSGVVTGELPQGQSIAGMRISLNVGGNLLFNQSNSQVGATNGNYAELGLFGNFSLVLDRGSHYLKVDSSLSLNIRDPQTAAAFSTTDFFEGSALYAFKINNPWAGPYARAGFRTRVFPGYLYLRDDGDTGVVNVNRTDGTVDSFEFGGEANPDDLRIQLAEVFAPFVLQQELGANLQAVDIDLRLLKLTVATRVGFGFREGLTNGLLVVDGDEKGSPITLNEVDNYWTLGPLAGATATVTFARWLFGTGEVGVMAPLRDVDRAGDNFGSRLLVDLSATGGFKLPVFSFVHASVDYTLRLQRDGYLTSDTQFAHAIMARANLQLF